jgi:hypothetical protein
LDHRLVTHWKKLLGLAEAMRLASSEYDSGYCRLWIVDCRLPIGHWDLVIGH